MIRFDTLAGLVEAERSEAVDSLVQRFNAEVGLQRVRYPLGQDLAGEPIHDGDEIEESTAHRQVGDVGAQDLIGSLHPQTAPNALSGRMPDAGHTAAGRRRMRVSPQSPAYQWPSCPPPIPPPEPRSRPGRAWENGHGAQPDCRANPPAPNPQHSGSWPSRSSSFVGDPAPKHPSPDAPQRPDRTLGLEQTSKQNNHLCA